METIENNEAPYRLNTTVTLKNGKQDKVSRPFHDYQNALEWADMFWKCYSGLRKDGIIQGFEVGVKRVL